MSEFETEWGVLSPWGCNSATDYAAAAAARNMREAGHKATVVWRGVTAWHHDMNDELAMQPVETKES